MRQFKNIDTFIKAMRKDKAKKLWADWFKIGGHWYTMEEYDDAGKYMRITSITKGEHIDLETSNRYSDNWLSDLEATAYPAEYYRFKWDYYLDIKDLIRFTGQELQTILVNISKAI